MKRAVLAAFILAAVGLGAFNAPATAADKSVAISGNAFHTGSCALPSGGSTTEIVVGDSVTWTNCDQVVHNVTSDTNAFPAKTLAHNESASQPFNTVGEYKYTCTIHSFHGVINVSDETTTTLTTPTTTPTTAAPTTTTTSTTLKPTTTTTTGDINGAFGNDTTPTEPTTTVFSTDTTRALGAGGDGGTSAGLVALLVLGLGGIGTAAALVVRRMRAASPPS
jgi:plastocyanin